LAHVDRRADGRAAVLNDLKTLMTAAAVDRRADGRAEVVLLAAADRRAGGRAADPNELCAAADGRDGRADGRVFDALFAAAADCRADGRGAAANDLKAPAVDRCVGGRGAAKNVLKAIDVDHRVEGGAARADIDGGAADATAADRYQAGNRSIVDDIERAAASTM
jgi:hypothetical protein